jgi:hypothetical protein
MSTSSGTIQEEGDETLVVLRALHLPYGPPDPYVTPWEMSSLSEAQEKVISLLPVFSGFLSVLGSLTIIYMVSRRCRIGSSNNRQRKLRWTTPYTRLLFGMSCCDIVSSITLMVMPFLLPSESSQRVWAFGNDATCSVIGFFQQFSLSAFLYNGCLSFYFVLTARYRWKNHQLARIIEPWMHIFSIGFPLATATAGSIMGIYHEMEIGQTCWITNYPENCEQDEDVPCQSVTLAWIFGGTVFLFAFLSIPINNLIIFLFVRKQTMRRGQHRGWGRRRRRLVQTKPQEVGKKSADSTLLLSTKLSKERGASVAATAATAAATAAAEAACDKENTTTTDRSNKNDEVELDSSSTVSEEDENNQTPEEQQRRIQQQSDDSSRRKDEQLQRLQLIASQTFLYVGAFFLCATWSFLLRIMESVSYNAEDENTLFPLLVLQAWFLPLQGFFNVFIYIRPKYLKHRRQYPEESRVWALRRSIHGEDDVQPSRCHPNATAEKQQQQQQQQQSIDAEAPLNDVGKQDSRKREQERDTTDTTSAFSRPLPRNNKNISSLSFEGLDDSSSYEDEIVQVQVQSEWRWSSGTNARQSKCSGGTSSLGAISELSAVSFIDPEEEEEDPLDESSSSGNDTLPDEDDTYLEATTIKSAPACSGSGSGSKKDRFFEDDEADSPSSQRRRWSIGNTTGASMDQNLQQSQTTNRVLATFIRTMFANLSPSDEDSSSSPSSDGSLDPSFDRMESINTPSISRDAPVQRPTRRLSPADLEISATLTPQTL